MVSVRYSPGKVWANFLVAFLAGAIIVAILGSLWSGGALTGGIAGLVVVVIMLGIGTLKRSSRQEPFLSIDARGVTVGLLDIGTIPWAQIQAARISGVPWVTGLRLTVEYAGTAPKVGFMDKLNWGIQAKQRGEQVRLIIGFMDVTDQSKSTLEAALARATAAPAR